MVNGVNRRARFDRRQAADFPFFEEVAVDADEAPVVLGSQFPGQGGLADTRFADEQWTSPALRTNSTLLKVSVKFMISLLFQCQFFIYCDAAGLLAAAIVDEEDFISRRQVDGACR